MRIIALLLIACVTFLSAFKSPGVETYSLSIEVNELRNGKGIVQFALYNIEGSIPDEHYKNTYKVSKGEIINGSSRITFRDLPFGKYAVNILHDENKNGKIDKGFIFPIEGIGFSNFQSIGFRNRPNFYKASFAVKGDLAIQIKVIYL